MVPNVSGISPSLGNIIFSHHDKENVPIIFVLITILFSYHGKNFIPISSIIIPIFSSEHGKTTIHCDISLSFKYYFWKLNLSHDLEEFIDLQPHQKHHIGRTTFKGQYNPIPSFNYDPGKVSLIKYLVGIHELNPNEKCLIFSTLCKYQ